MSRDASLTDFVDGTDDPSRPDTDEREAASDGSGTGAEADHRDGEDGRGSSGSGADPRDGDDSLASSGSGADGEGGVAPTLSWTPAGAPCSACGRSVERRWRGEGGPVCAACKEW